MKRQVDEHAARELLLSITHDGEFYKTRTVPALVKLAKKMRAGTYLASHATRVFLPIVKQGAKEFLLNNTFEKVSVSKAYSAATLHRVAHDMMLHYDLLIREMAIVDRQKHGYRNNPITIQRMRRGGFRLLENGREIGTAATRIEADRLKARLENDAHAPDIHIDVNSHNTKGGGHVRAKNPLKMSDTDYATLKGGITAIMANPDWTAYVERLHDDTRIKDFDKRVRWDALWLAKKYGHFSPDFIGDLYTKGLNDDHIDSALRQIMKEAGNVRAKNPRGIPRQGKRADVYPKLPPLDRWNTYADGNYDLIAASQATDARPTDFVAYYVSPRHSKQGKVLGQTVYVYDAKSNRPGHQMLADTRLLREALAVARSDWETRKLTWPINTITQQMIARVKNPIELTRDVQVIRDGGIHTIPKGARGTGERARLGGVEAEFAGHGRVTVAKNQVRQVNPAGRKHVALLRFGRDINGNKLVRVSTPSGSFTIQTLGNIPSASWMHKDDLKKNENIQKILNEVSAYVREFGTARQRRLMESVPGNLRPGSYRKNPAVVEDQINPFQGRGKGVVLCLESSDGARAYWTGSQWGSKAQAMPTLQARELAKALSRDLPTGSRILLHAPGHRPNPMKKHRKTKRVVKVYLDENFREVSRTPPKKRRRKKNPSQGWDSYDFRIATHYLPALINGDWSGLDDAETARLKAFITNLPKVKGHWSTRDEEGHFATDDVSGLKAMVVDVQYMFRSQ